MSKSVQLTFRRPAAQAILTDMPSVKLAEGQLEVAVTLAGVNFWEILQRHGRVPLGTPPIPGSEGVGIVTGAGSPADRALIGTRVAWSKVPHSYADVVVGDTDAFHVVPDSLDDATAAGVLFQGITAQYLATDTWPLGPGDTAVVTAAAGGVGLLLTQLLVHRGVEVIGVVSSAVKADAVLAAGAFHTMQYGEDLSDRVRDIAPDGVTAVYDSVGGPLPRQLLAALRPRGAIVLYGSASGSEADIAASDLGAGSYFLTRTAGRDYARTREEMRTRARAVLDLAAEGIVRVTVGGTWSLDQVDAAWDAMESRRTVGKLLLRP